MRSVIKISVLFVFLVTLITGCETTQPVNVKKNQVKTKEAAIAIARNEARSKGEEPDASEWTAKRIKNLWYVTSREIVYPKKQGLDRFDPKIFSTYIVSDWGEISKVTIDK